MKKIPIDAKLYRRLQRLAKAHNLTVDQLATKVFLGQIKLLEGAGEYAGQILRRMKK